MIEILILTHGNFGAELLKSAEMIIGNQQNITAFGLIPGMEPEKFAKAIQRKLDTIPDPSQCIILCDLFCGTPSNVSAMLSNDYDIECISGINMPMLIEACTMRLSLDRKTLVGNILKSGADGCKNIKEEFNAVKKDEI
ncbi:PTS sugar transporter subunit IIA [Pectinatus haikarae]|uniref:PTS sugar transporter subunit IIA n=1 Tax=Pectinatus haikarae TaxID=349096 RepID=UPI0018C52234|nr:PTS sugar transporter subunit IIA [Pectinatus haikarae]